MTFSDAKKFRHPWRGPFKILRKLSDLNYELEVRPGEGTIVHVNRMKSAGPKYHKKQDQIHESVGDMFDHPPKEALGHCVAADLHM